jgi:hypothetical protein
MVHTPGIVRWAINGYRTPKDRPVVIKVLCEGYGLTNECATALLSESVQYKVEGDTVVFNFDGQAT